MAQSPSHKFGQIIGNMLEEIIYPFLKEFTDKYRYYLDRKGERGQARTGKKVTWEDKYGNIHDLDFVIEDGGTSDKKGQPLAFIEAAWRRYTRHSRNKAQEIQGAVLPVAENYPWDAPFLGAVIAGIFTERSIQQLESVGFDVLYFPYETIIAAFEKVGIAARFDENTPDEDFKSCVEQMDKLSRSQWDQIENELTALNRKNIDTFIEKLKNVLRRVIKKIIVSPLFGNSNEFISIDEAIGFIGKEFQLPTQDSLRKIEIIIVYSNGDKIEGSFERRQEALNFLEYAKK